MTAIDRLGTCHLVGCPDKGQHPPHGIGCPDDFTPYQQPSDLPEQRYALVREVDLIQLLDQFGGTHHDGCDELFENLARALAQSRNGGGR